MQAAVRSRSQQEFRQTMQLQESLFDYVLPFKFKVEADFYANHKSVFLRECLAFEGAFSHSELLYQI